MLLSVAGSLTGPIHLHFTVGSALRENPFAPYVPCHRVIASTLYIRGLGRGRGLAPRRTHRQVCCGKEKRHHHHDDDDKTRSATERRQSDEREARVVEEGRRPVRLEGVLGRQDQVVGRSAGLRHLRVFALIRPDVCASMYQFP